MVPKVHNKQKVQSKTKKITNKALECLDFFDSDTSALKEITRYLLDRKY